MLRTLDPHIVSFYRNQLGENSTLFYLVHGFWEEGADARIAGYSWVDVSNATVSTLMLVYALLVWYIIPWAMRNRRPFELRNTILAYDFLLVLMNAYFFVESIRLSDYGRELFKLHDTRDDYSARARRYINVANLYYISKLVDMFDTFFMAFRKRYGQISFLHVWHHVSLSYAGWLYMKYNPYTPSILVIPFINSFIHMVMYSYYGLASLGPQMQKYLWWKRYITQIQLVQFVTVFLWYVFVYFKHEGLSTGYLWCNLGNATFLFVLFSNFYIQSYRQTKAKTAAKNEKVKAN